MKDVGGYEKRVVSTVSELSGGPLDDPLDLSISLEGGEETN